MRGSCVTHEVADEGSELRRLATRQSCEPDRRGLSLAEPEDSSKNGSRQMGNVAVPVRAVAEHSPKVPGTTPLTVPSIEKIVTVP